MAMAKATPINRTVNVSMSAAAPIDPQLCDIEGYTIQRVSSLLTAVMHRLSKEKKATKKLDSDFRNFIPVVFVYIYIYIYIYI